jgi:uncharacterized RDD family membrane protein YckC
MGEASNPYQAPQSDEDLPEQLGDADALTDASKGTRLSNLFIDYVFTLAVNYVMVALVGSRSNAGLMIYPVMIGYYVFFESIFGATPGKMITKTRVVAIGGGKPSMGQIIGRTLSRFVPFEVFSFLGSLGTGWHDRWSGTRVVYLPR